MKLINLVGCRFGRLTVLSIIPKDSRDRRWLCRCQCGRTCQIVGNNLRQGHSTSCGCFRTETTICRSTKHGHDCRNATTPEYCSWSGMIQRCTNPNWRRYRDWGGRGITICPQWRQDFSKFLMDMGPKPSLEYSLDRIDNSGNYEPGNCRWATRSQQRRNRRPVKSYRRRIVGL